MCFSQAVEWSPSPADGAVIGACVGQDVTLDWNYTLAQGETVEDIKWFSTDERSNQMIAFFASDSIREVTVHVDEMQARLTLIEAHQRALEDELKTENADLKEKNANLSQHLESVETRLNQYHETASKRVVWLKAYSTSNYWYPATVFSGFLLNADE
nr:hypothetical protein BaRGS_021142 [Batillaria attramentaria]